MVVPLTVMLDVVVDALIAVQVDVVATVLPDVIIIAQ